MIPISFIVVFRAYVIDYSELSDGGYVPMMKTSTPTPRGADSIEAISDTLRVIYRHPPGATSSNFVIRNLQTFARVAPFILLIGMERMYDQR